MPSVIDISGNPPFVYILVVNWNGWGHTIECLESLFRLDYPSFRVIVCDNGSTDGSVERIRAWADGKIDVRVPREHPLRRLSFPPVPKPVSCRVLRPEKSKGEGASEDGDTRLILIPISSNLGFAEGSNVGLRWAQSRGGFEYVWLLNNDTVVEKEALARLLQLALCDPRPGITGSTLLYYHAPDLVQAVGGGTWNRCLGTSRHFGGLKPRAVVETETASCSGRADFILGASMFVSRRFLAEVGLLCKDYFLYGEEVDWALRARGRFPLAVARQSLIYHKEGAATAGSAFRPSEKSALSDYYLVRSRLLLTRKFFPWALPLVYAGLLATMANRIRRRQWDRLGMIVRLAAGFLAGREVPAPPLPGDAEPGLRENGLPEPLREAGVR